MTDIEPDEQLIPAQQLAELSTTLGAEVFARRLWDRLTEEERQRLGEELEPLWRSKGTVGIWMQLHGVSRQRATIDLAMELGLLSEADYRRLLRESGEAPPASAGAPRIAPQWNREKGQLLFGGQLIRSVAGRSRSRNIRRLLDAFQEEGWPDRIDDPLPNGPNAQRLRDTIRTLNEGLIIVRFRADGAGTGIIWERTNSHGTPTQLL